MFDYTFIHITCSVLFIPAHIISNHQIVTTLIFVGDCMTVKTALAPCSCQVKFLYSHTNVGNISSAVKLGTMLHLNLSAETRQHQPANLNGDRQLLLWRWGDCYTGRGRHHLQHFGRAVACGRNGSDYSGCYSCHSLHTASCHSLCGLQAEKKTHCKLN